MGSMRVTPAWGPTFPRTSRCSVIVRTFRAVLPAAMTALRCTAARSSAHISRTSCPVFTPARNAPGDRHRNVILQLIKAAGRQYIPGVHSVHLGGQPVDHPHGNRSQMGLVVLYD